MIYKVKVSPAAERQFKKLTKNIQRRIMARLEKLAKIPRPAGAKKLSGMKDVYRVRVGNYRIVYVIQDDVLTVLVVKIAARKETYRDI